MATYFVVSIASGILFGLLDGLMNMNPFGQRLFQAYQAIAKMSINIPAGLIIDPIYGFVLGGLLLLLYPSLPGDARILKGISFAVLVWFLRVDMCAVSQWMMFKVPIAALL